MCLVACQELGCNLEGCLPTCIIAVPHPRRYWGRVAGDLPSQETMAFMQARPPPPPLPLQSLPPFAGGQALHAWHPERQRKPGCAL